MLAKLLHAGTDFLESDSEFTRLNSTKKKKDMYQPGCFPFACYMDHSSPHVSEDNVHCSSCMLDLSKMSICISPGFKRIKKYAHKSVPSQLLRVEGSRVFYTWHNVFQPQDP